MDNSSPFDQAIDAIIHGKAVKLRALVQAHPELVFQRAESFHDATLLHYIAANGVEEKWQKTPPNAVEIAEILLEAGAEPDATAQIYGGPSTTMELLVSSAWPYQAGLQDDLAACLIRHGAAVDGPDGRGAPLGLALGFGYTKTAEKLADLGARHDNLLFAAGLGKVELVKSFFNEKGKLIADGWQYIQHESPARGRFTWPPPANPDPLASPFIYACLHGRDEVVRFLLEIGVAPDISASYKQTGLHFAAYSGRLSTVELLLAKGADPSIRETQLNGTPKAWAAELGRKEVLELME